MGVGGGEQWGELRRELAEALRRKVEENGVQIKETAWSFPRGATIKEKLMRSGVRRQRRVGASSQWVSKKRITGMRVEVPPVTCAHGW